MRDRGKNGLDRGEDVPILVAAGFESTRNGGGTQRIAVIAHNEALRVGLVQVAEQGVRRRLGRIPRRVPNVGEDVRLLATYPQCWGCTGAAIVPMLPNTGEQGSVRAQPSMGTGLTGTTGFKVGGAIRHPADAAR